MRWFAEDSFDGPAAELNAAILARLRALGAAGQAVAVIVAKFVLQLSFPILLCFAIIAASAALTLYVRLRFSARRRIDVGWATGLLAFDAVQLAALVALTGGLANPFCVLFLAPVITAATALPGPRAAAVLALTLAAATTVFFFYLPISTGDGIALEAPFVVRVGIYVAIAVSAAFTASYSFLVAAESRKLARALATTELALAREQHLYQLDGLAAAAAHQLGTPLSTIALVAHEMATMPKAREAFGDDLALLETSARECREILSRLARPQEMAKGGINEAPLSTLLEEIAAPRRLLGVDIAIACGGQGIEPVLTRNAGALFGLGNIIENGVDHARSKLSIDAAWTSDAIKLTVADDGPGFPATVLDRVGEPYISTRLAEPSPNGRRTESGGMGLGLFIAIALLERSGATVAFSNGQDGGARVRVHWPRSAIEANRRSRGKRLESAEPLGQNHDGH